MTSGAETSAVALDAPEASEAPEAPRATAGINETRAGAVVGAVPRAGRLETAKTAIGVVVTNGTGPVARPKRLP